MIGCQPSSSATLRVPAFLLLLFLLPLLLLLLPTVHSLPEEIRIAGLFDEGAGDGSLETAFRYAVYRLNHDRRVLPKFAYFTDTLPRADSYRASKKVCYLVDKNPVAIFGPRAAEMANFVNSLCGAMNLPHLEYRLDTDHTPAPAPAINLYPNVEQLSRAFIDLVSYYGWKDMVVIYATQEDLVKVQAVLRGSYEVALDLTIRQVDASNLRQVLKEIKEKKWTNMLIDLDVDLTGMFLKMALQEGMIDPYHHYIITNLDIESIDMEDYRHNYVNMSGFRLVDPNDPLTRQVMHDMEIYEIQTDLRLLNKSGYISLPHHEALVFDAVYLLAQGLEAFEQGSILRPVNASCDTPIPWPSGPSLYTYLNQVSMKGLTGDIRLKQGRRFDFRLDVLQLKQSGLVKVGTWQFGTGLNFTTEMGFAGPHPFGNKTLVVTTLLEEPYVIRKEEVGPDGEEFEGFLIDMLKEIAAIVGFRYSIVPVPDGAYGAKDEKTGEWNGMVRELIDRNADLAVAPLTISYVREQVIDFTKPFLNLGITILFKVPRREKPGLFSFLSPLAIEIWLYVIGAYLLVSFTIFILARFSPYEWYNPHPCNPDTDTVQNTFTLSNSFWFTVGTLMQQGSDVNPRAVSTRIVGGIWWFFTLIIISSYTANLAAFLTVERMVSPIESAEDLAKQTEIKYGTLKSGSTWTFFKDSKIPVYKRMYEFMSKQQPSVFTDTYEEGTRRVLQGNYAYMMESTSIEYITQRNCDLMQVGGLLDSKGYGIGTPINSPYRDKLSMAILELQENGQIQMLYNKWWKGPGTCVREEKKDSKANSLGVENVGGIFVVLLAGLAMAVLVAICEFVWKSRRNAHAHEERQSLCSEMMEELRFAVRCLGSTQKPRFKRKCSKCKLPKGLEAHTHAPEALSDSPNGIIQLREIRRASPSASRDPEGREFRPGFSREFNGEYLHVDYSDPEA